VAGPQAKFPGGVELMSKSDEAIEATEEDFGELLIEGLREALAVERGELEPARRFAGLCAKRS
jgi:hypothetical protein